MKRYLVVEDEEINRTVLSSFLSNYAPCDTAENGKEGLSLFKNAHSEGNPYSLICVDLIMPEMNGLALIKEIRSLEKSNSAFSEYRTRIFVISACDSPWDKADLILDNLCDDYIVKPFDRCLFEEKLHRFNRLLQK
ncbi:MAG: response regulator [Deltaproteobacteria bacterium]|nr:response regulator [Deltaproteobacteria bacterium]